MSEDSPTNAVRLPAGVKIGAGRETSQTNDAGQVIQGMVWPITTPGGTTSTVFVANTDLHNTAKVQEIIAAKVAALSAIAG